MVEQITPTEGDPISKLINQSKRKGSSLGFDKNPDEAIQAEVMQVAVVRGRRRKIETSVGEKKVTGQTRLVRTPEGLKAIAGGDGASINVDDLAGLLNAKQTLEVTTALHKDRKRRRNNLQGK